MTTTFPAKRRTIALIVNTTAGRGRAGKAVHEIRDRLTSQDVEVTYHFTEKRGDGEHLAARAIVAGANVVAAVGGDGTLHEVANAIIAVPDRTVALGLLPIGTGNDFARGVGLFGDLAAACRILATAPIRHVDIGRISSPSIDGARWFLVAAGLGFVADIAATVNDGIRLLHGAPAYIYGAAKTLRHMRPFALTMTIDGNVTEVADATLVSVSNVATTGGGLKIAPTADPADGWLDVCLVSRIGKFELLRQLPAVARGTHSGHPAVTMTQGRHIEIATSEPKALWIDGEVIGHTPVSFEIIAGALPIVLPPL